MRALGRLIVFLALVVVVMLLLFSCSAVSERERNQQVHRFLDLAYVWLIVAGAVVLCIPGTLMVVWIVHAINTPGPQLPNFMRGFEQAGERWMGTSYLPPDMPTQEQPR